MKSWKNGRYRKTGTSVPMFVCHHQNRRAYTALYRRIVLWVEDKEEEMAFFTNHLDWGATTVTAVYKDRW